MSTILKQNSETNVIALGDKNDEQIECEQENRNKTEIETETETEPGCSSSQFESIIDEMNLAIKAKMQKLEITSEEDVKDFEESLSILNEYMMLTQQ